MIWKQWKRGKQRYAKLRHLGIGRDSPHEQRAARTALASGEQSGLSYALSHRLLRLACLPRLFDGSA